MIHYLRGTVLKKKPTFVVMDCSGIGFGIQICPKDAEQIGPPGAECSLQVYLHLTAGDARLYGFVDEKDLDYFLLLYGIDRVGPKTAMSVVSVLPRESFYAAVSSKDLAALLRVPGIGQKSAERIIFELREKVPIAGAPVRSSAPVEPQAVDALISLGFDRRSAEKAVEGALVGGSGSLESIVTAALRRLASVPTPPSRS